MLSLLDTLAGLLAPHECLTCGREGTLLCVNCRQLLPILPRRCYRCGKADAQWRTCQTCRRKSPLSSVRILTPYEGVAEALLHKLKFERAYAAGGLIGNILAAEQPTHFSPETLVVPIPTATGRVRQRGYDQAALLARRFAKHTALPYAQALLRLGQQRQTNSPRRERLQQLADAYRVRAKKLGGHTEVVLVDDVITTGSTLEAAARELKRVGVKRVHAVVFARAE